MGLIKKVIRKLQRKIYVPIYKTINSDNLLEGKIALIIGGSGDIGFSICKEFYKQGAKVILTGTNNNKLKIRLKDLNDDAKCSGVIVNLSNYETLEAQLKECIDSFPEKRVDILVNCAGINSNCSFFDVSVEEFSTILDINCKGLFFVSRFIAKHMIDNQIKGHILNISSASSLRPALKPYEISKWAVKGFTLGLADELIKYGIVVNAIGPGPVATNMNKKSQSNDLYHPTNPSGRYADPCEIASLATVLVSNLGDLIVGDTLYVSGGGGTTSLHN